MYKWLESIKPKASCFSNWAKWQCSFSYGNFISLGFFKLLLLRLYHLHYSLRKSLVDSCSQTCLDLLVRACARLRTLQRMWLRGVYLSRSTMHCYFKMVVTHFMIVTKNDIFEWSFFSCEYMVNTLLALFFFHLIFTITCWLGWRCRKFYTLNANKILCNLSIDTMVDNLKIHDF